MKLLTHSTCAPSSARSTGSARTFAVIWLAILLLPWHTLSAAEIQTRELTGMPAADIRNLFREKAEYKILRKGKRVGTHSVLITPDPSGNDNKFTVSVDSKIRITVLKVPVFTFRYQATERWDNNRLVSITATTVKNGERKTVSAEMAGNTMNTSITESQDAENPTRQTVEPVAFASNHWHPAVIDTDRIYNTLSGRVDSVSIETLGIDTLTLEASNGSTSPQQSALHVRYSGGFEAESWYADDGRWLQLLFKGTDGSLITYQYINP